MNSVTAIYLHNNQLDHLQRSIATVDWVDQILVLDHSPAEVHQEVVQALSSNKQIVVRSVQLNDDFSKVKNSVWDKVKTEWCFFIDPDERCTPELSKQIKAVINRSFLDGATLYRRDFFFDRFLRFGETSVNQFTRVVRKGKFRWVGKVHEKLVPFHEPARIGVLPKAAPLEHYSYSTMHRFLEKIDFYTTIGARTHRNAARTILEMILFPPAKFLYGYLILLGFRDGKAGFILAYCMSLHSLILRVKRLERLR